MFLRMGISEVGILVHVDCGTHLGSSNSFLRGVRKVAERQLPDFYSLGPIVRRILFGTFPECLRGFRALFPRKQMPLKNSPKTSLSFLNAK